MFLFFLEVKEDLVGILFYFYRLDLDSFLVFNFIFRFFREFF